MFAVILCVCKSVWCKTNDERAKPKNEMQPEHTKKKRNWKFSLIQQMNIHKMPFLFVAQFVCLLFLLLIWLFLCPCELWIIVKSILVEAIHYPQMVIECMQNVSVNIPNSEIKPKENKQKTHRADQCITTGSFFPSSSFHLLFCIQLPVKIIICIYILICFIAVRNEN